MTFELAKQLKDAGWKYSSWQEYEPTLSELIKACGDEFKGLLPPGIMHNEWEAIRKLGWIKPAAEDSNPQYKAIYKDWDTWGGKTPEEAVAKLWLALNK